MVNPSVLSRLFLLLPFTYPPTNNDVDNRAAYWNYEQNGADWGGTCATGIQQSPLRLSKSKSLLLPLPRILFGNYNVLLQGPLTVENDGHSVKMTIPITRNGERPYIRGGLLKSRYVADSVHFHWGSATSRGSEHTINRRQFDVEMHIVHRNVRYASLAEAVNYSDGVAVLGVLFKIVRNPDRIYPGLNKFFDEVSKVIKYEAKSKIDGSITVGQLLGDLNTRNFYTYKGSLTTPTCNEAVSWIIFSDVLPMPLSQVSKLWQVQDSSGHILRNNYRLQQPRNIRPIFYRTTKFKSDSI